MSFTAPSRRRSGSRSPWDANSMIRLATHSATGSVRSTSFSSRSAASKAVDRTAISSGPNAPLFSSRLIGATRSLPQGYLRSPSPAARLWCAQRSTAPHWATQVKTSGVKGERSGGASVAPSPPDGQISAAFSSRQTQRVPLQRVGNRKGARQGTRENPALNRQRVLVREPQQQNTDPRSGRTAEWLKCENPKAAAVTREAEEQWGGERICGLLTCRHC